MHMAEACIYGKGVEKNPERGAQWYRKAADSYRKAAEANDAHAAFILGNMYMRGQGIEKDLLAGVRLWRQAAALGHVKTMETLGFFFHFDTIDKIGEPLSDKNKAQMKRIIAQHIHWLRMAAEKGSMVGCNHMFEAYIGGEGGVVEKDPKIAVGWLLKGIQGKDEWETEVQGALAALARCYADGIGLEKNPDKANEMYARLLLLYHKRAQWGESEAQCLVADAYAMGLGVPKDKAQALAWYEKAASNGSARARTTMKKLQKPPPGPPVGPKAPTKPTLDIR